MAKRFRLHALCGVLLLPQLAQAHAVLERREAEAGSGYRGVVQVMHGCGESPTRSVRVTIPEGAVGARPMAKPGWTVATRRAPYAKTYPSPHGALSEGVSEITWSGGVLPADQFDEFVFTARLADDLRPGEALYFPVEQVCEAGAHRWVQVPTPGQDARALAEPAPSLRILPAAAQVAAAEPAVVKAGDLTIERPWIRATPGGARVAGGYLRITNTGAAPDRLVATSIPLARRGEVHEMSTEGGVMKMREVEGGLAIAPGQTVELKPGGFHLMFMDLTAGPREGDTVQGTLRFERAGTVEVAFQVLGIGAQGPAAAGGHAHH